MNRLVLAAIFATCAALLAGCGVPMAVGAPAGAPAEQPVTGVGMCAPGVPDCVDVVVEPAEDQPSSVEEALAEARQLLGLTEDALDPSTRISRRGGELMMLTEDYVFWRRTVELEADAAGMFRVVAVTVELPDGPQTVRG